MKPKPTNLMRRITTIGGGTAAALWVGSCLVAGGSVAGCVSGAKIKDSGSVFLTFGTTVEVGQRSASTGGTTAESTFSVSAPALESALKPKPKSATTDGG